MSTFTFNLEVLTLKSSQSASAPVCMTAGSVSGFMRNPIEGHGGVLSLQSSDRTDAGCAVIIKSSSAGKGLSLCGFH